MQKSSILSKAGHNLVSSNNMLPFTQRNQQKPQQKRLYLKSSISNNLLQQLDDDYKQIQGIESKYIDQNGNQVQQQITEITNNHNSQDNQNMTLVKKDKNSKNRFVQQSILQQESYDKKFQTSQSPIKSFIRNASLSSSKYQALNKRNNQSNLYQSQTQRSNGTLLKNYIKSINKYEAQLQELSRMKQNHKKNLNSKHSYLTNQSGLRQQDFYRLDYTNSGKYRTGEGLYNSTISKQSANFFNQKRNQLDQIEDILSDINSLNKSSENLKYSSAKIFPKNQINMISPSSKKYKGNKNLSSFNYKNKLSQTIDKYKSTKLDELLQGYQFNDTMAKSYGNFQNKSQITVQQRQSDFLKMSQSSIVDFKSNLQKRRKQRQQNRKNNRFYQQLKDQIKHGVDFNQKNEVKSIISDRNKQKSDQKIQQILQVGQDQELESRQEGQQINKKLQQDEELFQLARKFRLYQIKWNFLSVIPIKQSEVLLGWKNHPIFSEQEQRIIIGSLEKVQTQNIYIYSAFSSKLISQSDKNTQFFGLKKTSNNKSSKDTIQRLMDEGQFTQKWNKVYQESTKQKRQTFNLSSQEQKQLRQFDFKWYLTIVENVYHKTLQQMLSIYNNKKQDELKSTIKIQKFKDQIIRLNRSHQQVDQKPSIRECIALNKLKLLKKIFSMYEQTHQEYLFGIIPSIISKNTTEKEEIALKNYLKDNFRGGIYFHGKERQSNICILQLFQNNNLKIDQISNQVTKQVRINQNFVIKLKDQYKSLPSILQQDSFIISVSTPNKVQKNNQNQSNSIKFNCYYNQIQYQLQQQNPKGNQNINMFPKLKINLQK